MQLPYDQNVAISLRETVPGPLDHWIHTHGQNLPKQLLHRADSALPWTQSSWATAIWQAVTLKMQQQKPAVHMCVYIYTHTPAHLRTYIHIHIFVYIQYFFNIFVYKHTPQSAVGSDVLLFCTPVCDSQFDFSPPENLFFWLPLNNQIDVLC